MPGELNLRQGDKLGKENEMEVIEVGVGGWIVSI